MATALISQSVGNFLITGDAYLLAKKSVIPNCKQLRLVLKYLQFKQVIDKPTRIAPNSRTLLDIIATNRPQNISDSGVITTNLSGHEMVFCVWKINWKMAPAQIKTF